jgi:hypothetical protein
MRIHEVILEDQSVDEGLKDIVGRVGGHVVGALGAAGRYAADSWKDVKAGYDDAKSYWDAPGTRPAPRPAPTSSDPSPTPAPSEPVRKVNDVVADKGNTITGRYTGLKGKEWEIVGGKVWDNIKNDPTNDRRNRITRDATGKIFINAADAKTIYDLSENKKSVRGDFYSKFLDQML